LPHLPCRAAARLTRFPPSRKGRRCRVTTVGTLYPALNQAASLSSSTDSTEPRGPQSPLAAPLFRRRATRPSQAAVGELYRHFPATSSGRQDPPSRHYLTLVHRCAGASRWSPPRATTGAPFPQPAPPWLTQLLLPLSHAACMPTLMAEREQPSRWATVWQGRKAVE
jgi:hypothetical protein